MADDFMSGFMTGQSDNKDGGMGGGFMMIFLLVILVMSGGGGGLFGGNRNGGDCATKSDLCDGFNFNDLQRSVSAVGDGICSSTYALNTAIMQGFSGVDTALCNGLNNVNNNITQGRFENQQCCCETQKSIEAVRRDADRNTCDIIQSGHNDTDRVIAKLNQMESDRKDEKIAELQLKLNKRDFQISQNTQNGFIDAVGNSVVARVAPPAVPAFTVPAPFPHCVPVNSCGCGNCCA